MRDNAILDKSKKFAVRIVKLYKYLCSKNEYIMSKQLLRCGTSIGANVAEALCSISRKDFLAKMYISYKECAETEYWLDILKETEYLNLTEYESIINQCHELRRILSSITKTTRNNIIPNS